MRAFLTGATGLHRRPRGAQAARAGRRGGGARARPDKAGELREARLRAGRGRPLLRRTPSARGCEGADAVFHIGAIYKVGIPKSERPAMYEANVGGTERVLDAAVDAGVKRIVYVSTVGVLRQHPRRGRRRGLPARRTRTGSPATTRRSTAPTRSRRTGSRKGAPIVIVQPGGVYGPNDHSEVGNMIEQTQQGQAAGQDVPRHGHDARPRRGHRRRASCSRSTRARSARPTSSRASRPRWAS